MNLRTVGRAATAALAILAAVVAGGCGQTERTITVTSEPAGALVYVNGEEKGRTPCQFDFLWYGDYRFELVKDGYEKLDTHRHVRAMPNQWPAVDLIGEVFVPVTQHDEKHFHFELTKLAKVSQDELIDRANRLRDQTLHEEK